MTIKKLYIKPIIIAIISFFTLVTCQPNGNQNPNCRFLANIGINETVYLNLVPGVFLTSGTSVLIESPAHRGIIVTQVGADYFAWDAADPNHPFDGSCRLTPTNNNGTFGFEATCNCGDGNTYSLVNGLPLNNGELRCGLINYRVERSDNILYISN